MSKIETLELADLVHVTGGAPGGPAAPPDDPANQVGNDISRDWQGANSHAADTADNLNNHQYGQATVNFAKTAADVAQIPIDVIRHFNPFS